MFFAKSFFASFGLAVSFLNHVQAHFVISCARPVLVERVDPIETPGRIGHHVHTIMGSSGFDFDTDYDSARAGSCTSCNVEQDMSAYWIPTLYHRAKNGTVTSVRQRGGAAIYYLFRAQSPDGGKKLTAFPKGFRMVAGDSLRRSFDANDKRQAAITYVCLGGSGPDRNGFPPYDCPEGLRVQVFFPSCWDGKNLDSKDHKSHVAYPEGQHFDNGVCPQSHPVPLASLFYEVIYEITDFKDQWWDGNRPPFVFSNGDATGFGLHGDFLNGWDVDVLQEALDTCDKSGNIADCKALKLQDHGKMMDCAKGTAINEKITGSLHALPGCNPITFGPKNATVPKDCPEVVSIGNRRPVGYTDTSSLGYSYLGCARDDNPSRRTLNSYTFTSDAMTVELCISTCSSRGFIFAGVEYSRECFCGSSIDRSLLNAGGCSVPCAGRNEESCGGPGRLGVYVRNGSTGGRRERREERMNRLKRDVELSLSRS